MSDTYRKTSQIGWLGHRMHPEGHCLYRFNNICLLSGTTFRGTARGTRGRIMSEPEDMQPIFYTATLAINILKFEDSQLAFSHDFLSLMAWSLNRPTYYQNYFLNTFVTFRFRFSVQGMRKRTVSRLPATSA